MNEPESRASHQGFWGMLIHPDLVLVNVEAENATDILSRLSERLRKRGCIKDGFLEALLDREANYPTGLKTKTIPVAIPHADPVFVAQPALAVATLKQGVEFRLMDDASKVVEVHLVLLIALNEPQAQIEFLRRFALVIKSDEFLPNLQEVGDESRMCAILAKEFLETTEDDAS